MHTKSVHRRQFNIYIFLFCFLKKRKTSWQSDRFDFCCTLFVVTLCKAVSDIQFTEWCCIFAQCHLLIAFSCYWLSRKRYSTFALQFLFFSFKSWCSLCLTIHSVSNKERKQCLKTLMLSSFGRFSLWREIQLMF